MQCRQPSMRGTTFLQRRAGAALDTGGGWCGTVLSAGTARRVASCVSNRNRGSGTHALFRAEEQKGRLPRCRPFWLSGVCSTVAGMDSEEIDILRPYSIAEVIEARTLYAAEQHAGPGWTQADIKVRVAYLDRAARYRRDGVDGQAPR